MTVLLRNMIILGVLLILIFEIGSLILESSREAEANNPLDRDGKIKDGQMVSFEEEERLAVESFPTVKEKEYAESMLYGLSQCIIGAEALGEAAYACIGNNFAEGVLGVVATDDEVVKGKLLYEALSEYGRVTGIDFKEMKETDSLSYKVLINYDRDATNRNAIIHIVDRKIATFEWTEGVGLNE